jgi:hypothetical protein
MMHSSLGVALGILATLFPWGSAHGQYADPDPLSEADPLTSTVVGTTLVSSIFAIGGAAGLTGDHDSRVAGTGVLGIGLGGGLVSVATLLATGWEDRPNDHVRQSDAGAVGGFLLTAAGAGTAGVSIAYLANLANLATEPGGDGTPFLVPMFIGVGLMGGGVPLMVWGTRRQTVEEARDEAFEEAQREAALPPTEPNTTMVGSGITLTVVGAVGVPATISLATLCPCAALVAIAGATSGTFLIGGGLLTYFGATTTAPETSALGVPELELGAGSVALNWRLP